MTTTKKPKKTTRASTPIEDLPPNPFVFEVLNVVNKQRSTAKKVEALKKFAVSYTHLTLPTKA